MACIVAIDVANRFICRSDYFYRKYIVQIFCTPVFFSGRQPGRSGLGFVIAATATVMLHFAYSSWIAELGLSVVDSEDSGAVTFTVFAVHETVISIRPQQVP